MHDGFLVASEGAGEGTVRSVCVADHDDVRQTHRKLCGVEQRGLLAARE